MSSRLAVTTVETWACRLPLRQPLDFGRFQVKERHYAALRLRTSGGLMADVVSQTRGVPLDMVIAEVIAPRLLGRDALNLAVLTFDMEDSLAAVEFDGSIGRAWSMVEIALQDLRAQAAGWPLWRLLGGRPRAVPVLLVEGYALVGETDEAFAERLAARVEEGYSALKMEAAHYSDPDAILRRLVRFRELAGPEPRLVLDFAWSWANATDRADFVKAVAPLAIDWIEDSFPRHRITDYARLRRLGVPIGCGDEATRPADLRALIAGDAVDVLRLDATTIGGIETVRHLSDLARRQGIRISFHEHPEVHEHCVFGLNSADHIEMFPIDRPFDRVHDLLETCPAERVSAGRLEPQTIAGSGIRLREAALAQFAHRHTKVGAD